MVHQSFGITRSFNIFIFKRVAFFGTLNVFPHVVVPIVGLENPTEFHRKKPSIPACRGWRTGSFHHGYPVFITKSQKFSSPIHMDLRPYSTIGQQKLCGFFLYLLHPSTGRFPRWSMLTRSAALLQLYREVQSSSSRRRWPETLRKLGGSWW